MIDFSLFLGRIQSSWGHLPHHRPCQALGMSERHTHQVRSVPVRNPRGESEQGEQSVQFRPIPPPTPGPAGTSPNPRTACPIVLILTLYLSLIADEPSGPTTIAVLREQRPLQVDAVTQVMVLQLRWDVAAPLLALITTLSMLFQGPLVQHTNTPTLL